MLRTVKNLLLVASVVCYWGISYCPAQDAEPLIVKKGQVVSKGSNKTPSGALGVTTYTLEVITPARNENYENKFPENKFFRLTIKTDKKLPLESFSIWIDGRENYGAVRVGQKSVALVMQAKSLPSGSSLGLSIRGKKDPADRSLLPETLFVPPEYATPLSEIEANKPVIKLRRLRDTIELRVEFPNGSPCRGTASLSPELEIEGFRRPEDVALFICTGRGFATWLLPEELGRIADGAEIRMKTYSGDDVTTKVIGRLDKSTLQ